MFKLLSIPQKITEGAGANELELAPGVREQCRRALQITPLLRAGLLRRGHEREPGDGCRADGGDAGLARYNDG